MWDNENDECNENDDYDPSLEEEDVNFEAAKDLDEDRLRGIRARCLR
ncbi:MAG: hypothetical protein WC248_05890 [Candidatus Methanomethylophilaceae archaeon]|jgi:hypothetical protein